MFGVFDAPDEVVEALKRTEIVDGSKREQPAHDGHGAASSMAFFGKYLEVSPTPVVRIILNN